MAEEQHEDILDRNVVVSLSGLPSKDGSEGVEMMCPGVYHYRNGRHFISYDETTIEDSKAPDTHCLLKLSDREVEIVKRGTVTTRMLFAPDMPNVSVYSTPFGDITVGTNVSSLQIKEDKHRLQADLLYTLEMNYEYAQECHLTITVTD